MTLTSPNRGYPLERIEGNSGSMSWWSGEFTRVAGKLDELSGSAELAHDLPGVGRSVTTARDDAGELVAAIRPQILEAELLSGVLQRYVDAYEAHAQPANRMIDEIGDAHEEWERLGRAAASAGSAAMHAAYGDDQAEIDATNDAATEAIADRDAAKEALDELWVEYERHYGDWDAAYDAALSELSGGVGATQLTAAEQAFLDSLLAARSPEEVLELWNANPGLHDELIGARPELVGNLDGIPYEVRAQANESVLIAMYHSDLEEPQRSEIEALYLEALFNGGHLIAFDPNGSAQATAALWYGEFDAGNVSVLIPGMNSNVAGIGEWGTSAHDLNAAVGPESATIVWFGYDSPDPVEEPGMHRAEDGAAALIGFLNGLDALAPTAQLNVVAHSYGSTTAALAIGSQPDGLGVDQFITVGSAGLPNDETVLANLQSEDAPQIFATMADDDFWAPVGQMTSFGHSVDPSSLDGAVEFDSDGGQTADGDALAATPGHSAHEGANSFWGQDGMDGGYLLDGSESFYNVQQIIATGEPGTESGGAGSVEGTLWEDIERVFSGPSYY